MSQPLFWCCSGKRVNKTEAILSFLSKGVLFIQEPNRVWIDYITSPLSVSARTRQREVTTTSRTSGWSDTTRRLRMWSGPSVWLRSTCPQMTRSHTLWRTLSWRSTMSTTASSTSAQVCECMYSIQFGPNAECLQREFQNPPFCFEDSMNSSWHRDLAEYFLSRLVLLWTKVGFGLQVVLSTDSRCLGSLSCCNTNPSPQKRKPECVACPWRLERYLYLVNLESVQVQRRQNRPFCCWHKSQTWIH